MSTAGATVSKMNDAPLHTEFPFRANVSSLQARRVMRPSASSQISLVWEKNTGSKEIVGNSPALQPVLELVKRVTPYDSTLLPLGETGTGTELDSQIRALSIERPSIQMISTSTRTRVVVPRDLVKSREFFVAFAQKFSGCLLERLLHFTVAEE